MDDTAPRPPSKIPDELHVELRPQPHEIVLQFSSSWSVVLPGVYRYENEEWIDQFFDTGKIRLATFAKFATYPDEVRGDKQEATGLGYGETPGGVGVSVFQTVAVNSAVLSCSHRLSTHLRDAFGRNSAFEIMDTARFAAHVGRQLVGFRGGLEGSCIYRSDTTIKRSINFDHTHYDRQDGTTDLQMAFDAGKLLGGQERILLKRIQYAEQQEYRLLWHLDKIETAEIDVFAPDARQFCRKVKPSDWD